MEYRRFENTYLVRLDKGDEVLAALKALCRKENITLAVVQGIGAISDVSLAVRYRRTLVNKVVNYRGDMEIASCTGTITAKDDAPYPHLHIVIANVAEKFCCGGHLERAVVSLNAEFTLTVCRGSAARVYCPESAIERIHFES